MKILATAKQDQNRAMFDPWTAVHFAAGLALGLVSAPRSASLGVALGYEIAEQFLERNATGQGLFKVSGPETAPNAAVDLIAFAAGHYLGDRWNRT